MIRFFIALAVYLITVVGTAVVFRHEIIGNQSGFYDHDRWTGRVVACAVIIQPEVYYEHVAEMTSVDPHPPPPQGWTQDEWQAYRTKPSAPDSVPPGKQPPTAEEFLGRRPLSLAEANAAVIAGFGDYLYCAPRPDDVQDAVPKSPVRHR